MIVVIRLPRSRASRGLIRVYESCAASGSRFVRLAVAAALMLTITAPVETREAVLAVHPVHRADLRVTRLKTFFQTYRCQEPHHVEEYLRAADIYGLDYRLLPAISIRFTTTATTERDNNWWGYHPGRQ